MSSGLPSQPPKEGGRQWRVIVADPSAVSRRALCAFLEAHPAFELVGDCDNATALLALAQRRQPNLVLVELSLSKLEGGALSQQLGRCVPGLRVLLMSVHATAEAHRLAQACGAAGLLDKNQLPAQLLMALGLEASSRSSTDHDHE